MISIVDVGLIVILVILVFGFGYNKMRLVEHNVNGGRKKILHTTSNIDKLECIVSKKEAEEIMDAINDEFGDSKFLVDSKVDIIVDKFKDKKDKDICKILESINIHKGTVEKVNVDKRDDEIFSSLHKCPRCKKRRHTVKESQRRAIDEPTTVKCCCLECGMNWVED